MEPRRSTGWPILLGVVLIGSILALGVGWVLVSIAAAFGSENAAFYWVILGVGVALLVLLLIGVIVYLFLTVKAIALSQRQSNFIDSVTHELKSPLASLKLYLQTLNRRQVSPERWRELLDDPGVVVIDNRNHFEVRLGRFRNAVDPLVRNFRDFPAYIEAQLPLWRAEGKQVAMYCTGGIRCEKTSAWLQQRGVEVLQLEGGILNYFARMPDAELDWAGECFVFDNRIALDTRLRETGTTAAQVYAGDPEEAWRLERALRLEAAADGHGSAAAHGTPAAP
jgi:rhodanese-related sulfurtransferase